MLSRSGFLKQLAGTALQALPVLVPALALITPENERESRPERDWLEIGSLADFPPGCEVLVNGGKHVIRAHERGLVATDQADPALRRPLRLEINGQVSLHPHQLWPARACLSSLTGNQILEEDF